MEKNILISGVCIIEWGEIVESILPEDYIKISFSTDFEDETIRYLTIESHGKASIPMKDV